MAHPPPHTLPPSPPSAPTPEADAALLHRVIPALFHPDAAHADPEMMAAVAASCHTVADFAAVMQAFRAARAARRGYSIKLFEAQLLLWLCGRWGSVDDALFVFGAAAHGSGDVMSSLLPAVTGLLYRQCDTLVDVARVSSALAPLTGIPPAAAGDVTHPTTLPPLATALVTAGRTDLLQHVVTATVQKHGAGGVWRQWMAWAGEHIVRPAHGAIAAVVVVQVVEGQRVALTAASTLQHEGAAPAPLSSSWTSWLSSGGKRSPWRVPHSMSSGQAMVTAAAAGTHPLLTTDHRLRTPVAQFLGFLLAVGCDAGGGVHDVEAAWHIPSPPTLEVMDEAATAWRRLMQDVAPWAMPATWLRGWLEGWTRRGGDLPVRCDAVTTLAMLARAATAAPSAPLSAWSDVLSTWTARVSPRGWAVDAEVAVLVLAAFRAGSCPHPPASMPAGGAAGRAMSDGTSGAAQLVRLCRAVTDAVAATRAAIAVAGGVRGAAPLIAPQGDASLAMVDDVVGTVLVPTSMTCTAGAGAPGRTARRHAFQPVFVGVSPNAIDGHGATSTSRGPGGNDDLYDAVTIFDPTVLNGWVDAGLVYDVRTRLRMAGGQWLGRQGMVWPDAALSHPANVFALPWDTDAVSSLCAWGAAEARQWAAGWRLLHDALSALRDDSPPPATLLSQLETACMVDGAPGAGSPPPTAAAFARFLSLLLLARPAPAAPGSKHGKGEGGLDLATRTALTRLRRIAASGGAGRDGTVAVAAAALHAHACLVAGDAAAASGFYLRYAPTVGASAPGLATACMHACCRRAVDACHGGQVQGATWQPTTNASGSGDEEGVPPPPVAGLEVRWHRHGPTPWLGLALQLLVASNPTWSVCVTSQDAATGMGFASVHVGDHPPRGTTPARDITPLTCDTVAPLVTALLAVGQPVAASTLWHHALLHHQGSVAEGGWPTPPVVAMTHAVMDGLCKLGCVDDARKVHAACNPGAADIHWSPGAVQSVLRGYTVLLGALEAGMGECDAAARAIVAAAMAPGGGVRSPATPGAGGEMVALASAMAPTALRMDIACWAHRCGGADRVATAGDGVAVGGVTPWAWEWDVTLPLASSVLRPMATATSVPHLLARIIHPGGVAATAGGVDHGEVVDHRPALLFAASSTGAMLARAVHSAPPHAPGTGDAAAWVAHYTNMLHRLRVVRDSHAAELSTLLQSWSSDELAGDDTAAALAGVTAVLNDPLHTAQMLLPALHHRPASIPLLHALLHVATGQVTQAHLPLRSYLLHAPTAHLQQLAGTAGSQDSSGHGSLPVDVVRPFATAAATVDRLALRAGAAAQPAGLLGAATSMGSGTTASAVAASRNAAAAAARPKFLPQPRAFPLANELREEGGWQRDRYDEDGCVGAGHDGNDARGVGDEGPASAGGHGPTAAHSGGSGPWLRRLTALVHAVHEADGAERRAAAWLDLCHHVYHRLTRLPTPAPPATAAMPTAHAPSDVMAHATEHVLAAQLRRTRWDGVRSTMDALRRLRILPL